MSQTQMQLGARRSAAAFSLLEMLFVIAIIGLIATLAIPRLAGAFSKGQAKTTRANLERLTAAVEDFRMDVQRYPTEEEGLSVLIEQPTDEEQWKGPYLNKRTLPQDGWGRPFLYKSDEDFGFVIISYGADGKQGGDGDNQDLDNRS